jgi:microsomal dipeptidase-like Zn-dependent dipeptidase
VSQDVTVFMTVESAVKYVEDRNAGQQHISIDDWMKTISTFVNSSGMHVVSVGYDNQGMPRTLVLRGEPSKASTVVRL